MPGEKVGISVMASNFDLLSISLEQTGCIVDTFKKRLQPCVCDETSSR